MTHPKTKIITILGPTASGKTGLAIELAERFGGEIVCADSRTIYRGLDIGSAKPTSQERARVPHHVLDVVAPDQTYSAQQFKLAAEQVIAEIAARGKVPFLVGGSGLYLYSVVYDYQFPAGPRTAERVELEQLPITELVQRLQQNDPDRASEIDLQNPRRVIRALETAGQARARRPELPENILLLGLKPDTDVLKTNIVQRAERMQQIGLAQEVQTIVAKYGPELEVLRSPGYAEMVDYLAGRTSLQQAVDLIALHTRQLARRQMTWFKRDPAIRWLSEPAEATDLVADFLRE